MNVIWNFSILKSEQATENEFSYIAYIEFDSCYVTMIKN